MSFYSKTFGKTINETLRYTTIATKSITMKSLGEMPIPFTLDSSHALCYEDHTEYLWKHSKFAFRKRNVRESMITMCISTFPKLENVVCFIIKGNISQFIIHLCA